MSTTVLLMADQQIVSEDTRCSLLHRIVDAHAELMKTAMMGPETSQFCFYRLLTPIFSCYRPFER